MADVQVPLPVRLVSDRQPTPTRAAIVAGLELPTASNTSIVGVANTTGEPVVEEGEAESAHHVDADAVGGAGDEEIGAQELPNVESLTNGGDEREESNDQNEENATPLAIPSVPLEVPILEPTSETNEEGADGEEQNSNEQPLFPEPEFFDLDGLFPYCDEDDIDLGRAFEGEYKMYEPVYDLPLPFFDMEDADLPEVVKGNFTTFFQMRSGHEFYRNYVRGNTKRKLRMAKDSIKGKPGALKGLLQLPVELLYDILEQTHPMDLMHLSRTSKGLRKVILDKSCQPVWKNAYDNYGDLHCPPEDVSYPKWTGMIYDDARCDFCDNPGALLDFALGEHYCEKCQDKYLIEQNHVSDVTDKFPRLLPTLFQLLPATYRQSGGKYQCYYESDSNSRYRRTDVEKMIEELKTWFITIDEGMIPDAGQKFDEWCAPQIKKARALSDNAQMLNSWATSFYYNLCTELSSKQRTLAELCMKRFSKMGYDEQDTNAAVSDIYYYFRSVEVWDVSRKTLEQHKDEIISKIEAQKLDRMKRERRVIADKTYNDYKRTLKPSQWAGLPPADIVAAESVFCRYIYQDTLTNVEELDVPKAMAALPEVIDEWHFDRQKELYDLLPGVEVEDIDYLQLEDKDREGLSDEEILKRTEELRKERKAALKVKMDERMKRARTMFSCISCKSGRHSGLAVFGWKDAIVHMAGSYSHYFHSNWEFCSVGYAAASSLISQLGLDPDTATLDEVDAKDARFLCMNCPTKTHKQVQGRKAYTWRECVQHAVEKQEDFTHAVPTCLLLSEDATAFIRSHELPHPSPRRVNWSCNHCPEHLEGPVLLKDAVKHVKESHSIESPVKGVDVIYLHGRYERNHNGKRRPIFHYGVEPTCHLICNLCRQGKVRRLWTIQALVPHLFHSHGITMPRSTRDYSKIEVYAT